MVFLGRVENLGAYVVRCVGPVGRVLPFRPRGLREARCHYNSNLFSVAPGCPRVKVARAFPQVGRGCSALLIVAHQPPWVRRPNSLVSRLCSLVLPRLATGQPRFGVSPPRATG
jgi:hypothetical protein